MFPKPKQKVTVLFNPENKIKKKYSDWTFIKLLFFVVCFTISYFLPVSDIISF